jgi:hypothetical protein
MKSAEDKKKNEWKIIREDRSVTTLSVTELAWRRKKIQYLREIDWRKIKRNNVELVSLIFAVAEIMAKESIGMSQRNQRLFYETTMEEKIEEIWKEIKGGKYNGKERCIQILYYD